jgi:hypothetical protein
MVKIVQKVCHNCKKCQKSVFFLKIERKKGGQDTPGLIVSYINIFCSFKAFGTN